MNSVSVCGPLGVVEALGCNNSVRWAHAYGRPVCRTNNLAICAQQYKCDKHRVVARHQHPTAAFAFLALSTRLFTMMFNKLVAVVAAFVGASSMLVGALPTNVTESAIAARAIDPAGTHTGQVRTVHLSETPS
jgi:hypothetical protein